MTLEAFSSVKSKVCLNTITEDLIIHGLTSNPFTCLAKRTMRERKKERGEIQREGGRVRERETDIGAISYHQDLK